MLPGTYKLYLNVYWSYIADLPQITTYTTETFGNYSQTNLLHRLHTQTLPDSTPPIGNIHPSSKIALTFEPMM